MLAGVLAGLALAAPVAPVEAQYRLTTPSGVVLEFQADELLAFRDRSDSLRRDLEEDPEVLYYTSFGADAAPDRAEDAMPWNSVEVVTDSTAALLMPGNLREAQRAYMSYVVLRMHAVRGDPDVPCAELVDRELQAVDGFVDGWIAARTLFGGPAYAPLDELAFARAAGVLPGLVMSHGDPQLGGCLDVWRGEDPELAAAYETWRTERYLGDG